MCAAAWKATYNINPPLLLKPKLPQPKGKHSARLMEVVDILLRSSTRSGWKEKKVKVKLLRRCYYGKHTLQYTHIKMWQK